MRLLPAIDLRGGQCVRLRQGDFEDELTFDVDPLDLLDRYADWGADWVHVVDLDGARDQSSANDAVIDSLIGRSGLKLQVGGGLRSRAKILRMLERGAARAVVGSLAVTAAREVHRLLESAGSDRITVALDVRVDDLGVPWIVTHGWRDQSGVTLWDAVDALAGRFLRHVLCTDVSRDGMLSGPNLDLYAEARSRYPRIEWQASGGIRDAADLAALARVGAAAAVSGRALLENRIPAAELKPFLPNA